jgi:hypothetical protein
VELWGSWPLAKRLWRRRCAALRFAGDFEDVAGGDDVAGGLDRLAESGIGGAISGVHAEVSGAIAKRRPRGPVAPGRHGASGGARLCGIGRARRPNVG